MSEFRRGPGPEQAAKRERSSADIVERARELSRDEREFGEWERMAKAPASEFKLVDYPDWTQEDVQRVIKEHEKLLRRMSAPKEKPAPAEAVLQQDRPTHEEIEAKALEINNNTSALLEFLRIKKDVEEIQKRYPGWTREDMAAVGEIASQMSRARTREAEIKEEEWISNATSEQIIENLPKFPNVDRLELARGLVKNGQAELVAGYLWQMTGLDDDIAKKLIKAGCASSVAMNLNAFKNASLSMELALDLVGQKSRLTEPDSDHPETFELPETYGEAVLGNIDAFRPDMDFKKLAKKLVEAGDGEALLEHIQDEGSKYFTGVTKIMVRKLMKGEKIK